MDQIDPEASDEDSTAMAEVVSSACKRICRLCVFEGGSEWKHLHSMLMMMGGS